MNYKTIRNLVACGSVALLTSCTTSKRDIKSLENQVNDFKKPLLAPIVVENNTSKLITIPGEAEIPSIPFKEPSIYNQCSHWTKNHQSELLYGAVAAMALISAAGHCVSKYGRRTVVSQQLYRLNQSSVKE